MGITVFLFTDIEGSTRLWERLPAAMGEALRRHDAILRDATAAHGGTVFKTVGDAFCIVFGDVAAAAAAAAESQRRLAAERWGETGPLRVRMAIHAGHAERRDDDYFGTTLNRVARMLGAAHGGQVLLSLPARELVEGELPASVSLRDLGERHLRDLSRPEHLFQLVIDGLPAEFPPLRTVETIPNNLPVALSSFVGRERERAEVKRLLGAGRLVTLTGTGGTGKTRLALQVAEELLGDFSDGIWLVELATISDPDRILEAAAAAVGLREEPGETPRDALLRFVCGRRMLLILDNCEHLIEACAGLVAEILRRCSTIKVLATSRHSLGIAGEQAWGVPPLSVPGSLREDGARTPESVGRFEAVRLFVERAAAAKPGFALTQQNAGAVARICRRLDGIPLALELAAARVRVLAPQQISERLDDRFHLLTGGGRSVLPHQQTLRTLIDWSHDLLSLAEQTLFRRLAVFVGGRTLDAVEAVCAGEGIDREAIVDLLQSLADKSLLSVETDAADAIRYTMIESVWHYAGERLEASGEEEWIRDRHLDYFLRLTEEAAPRLLGPETPLWLDRIDADRYNMRRAMEWAAAAPDRVQQGLRMAGGLMRYFEIRGSLEEARDVFALLLAAPGSETRTDALADALFAAGRLAWVREDSAGAMARYRAAIGLYRELGRERDAVMAETLLAFVECELGDRETVEARFRRAIEEGHTRRDVTLTAVGLSGLGRCAMVRGDFARSRRLREESLAIYRATGDEWVSGYLLWGIARACVAGGDAPAARAALEEWAGIARRFGNRWVVPYLLVHFAEVRLLEHDPEGAVRLLGAAEAGRESLGLVLGDPERREWEAVLTRVEGQIAGDLRAKAWALGRRTGLWEAVDAAVQAGLAMMEPSAGTVPVVFEIGTR